MHLAICKPVTNEYLDSFLDLDNDWDGDEMVGDDWDDDDNNNNDDVATRYQTEFKQERSDAEIFQLFQEGLSKMDTTDPLMDERIKAAKAALNANFISRCVNHS
jgi:hypothetical protein